MRRARAATALVACLALAACGSDDTERRYVDEVNAAQARLTQTFARLQSQISNVSRPARDAAVLGRYEAAVDRAVADLRAISPPGDAEALHAALIRHTRSYRDVIAPARTALARGEPAEVVKAQVDLTTGITRVTGRINDTTAKLNRALRD